MYENDHKVVAEVAKTAALEAEAEGVLSELRGKTV
jgi:hypothetical protein